MKYAVFYVIPLAVYLGINLTTDSLGWPQFLLLFPAFLLFQLAQLKYPKKQLPIPARAAQLAFFLTTVALILRERFFDETIVTGLIGATTVLAIIDVFTPQKQPSA